MDILIYQMSVQVPEGTDHAELGKAIQDDLVDSHPAIESATVSLLEEQTAEIQGRTDTE